MRALNRQIDEAGGAMVEAAILGMLFCPIIVYATFFFDLSLLNLKVLEASRYATWEMTNIEELAWNWGDGGYNFSTASDIVSNEIQTRWGDDMNSATCKQKDEANNCLFSEQSSGFSVTKLQENGVVSTITDGPVSFLGSVVVDGADSTENEDSENWLIDMLGNVLDFAGKASNWVYKNLFKMNTDGFVSGKVTATLEFDRTAPVPVLGNQSMLASTLFTVEGQEKLLVDAWDLRDGQDVDEGYGHKISQPTPYYAQVKRMFFFGAVEGVGDLFEMGLEKIGLGDLLDYIPFTFSDFLALFNIHNPFNPVVRSYRLQGLNASASGEPYGSCRTSQTACIDYDNGPNKSSSENIADPESHHSSRRLFYTNVYKDNPVADDSPYYRVYKRQGGYYMGCNKAQQESCRYE